MRAMIIQFLFTHESDNIAVLDLYNDMLRHLSLAFIFYVHFFRVFRHMDEDGNKKLNLEEFKTGLEEIHLELSEDEINEIFKKFDTDEDGNISVDEFIIGIRVSSRFFINFI